MNQPPSISRPVAPEWIMSENHPPDASSGADSVPGGGSVFSSPPDVSASPVFASSFFASDFLASPVFASSFFASDFLASPVFVLAAGLASWAMASGA